MISFKKFANWYPDFPSEDRVSMVILHSVLSTKWGLVYYNPPSGSWKRVTIYNEGYEYRQVGPKRGVKRLKRPDIAFQDLASPSDSPRFLLFEDKKSRYGWDRNLPELLEAYFEDKKEGVQRLPFDHRRKQEEQVWEKLSEGNPYREWFTKAQPTYIFGFAYGPIPTSKIQDEREWIRSELNDLQKSTPPPKQENIKPLVIVALGFESPTMKPVLVREYSVTFPEDLRNYLESRFENAMVEG